MVQIENNKDSGLTFPKIWTSGGTIQKKKNLNQIFNMLRDIDRLITI